MIYELETLLTGWNRSCRTHADERERISIFNGTYVLVSEYKCGSKEVVPKIEYLITVLMTVYQVPGGKPAIYLIPHANLKRRKMKLKENSTQIGMPEQ